jgi:hypothetical protein
LHRILFLCTKFFCIKVILFTIFKPTGGGTKDETFINP